jgi:DNA-binding winged helix-turn-helix (wHTH) protein/tetratricopeptide (TPR) repeat protein
MSSPGNHFYEFGPFRLDLAERVLLRDGRPLTLTPKAFDLLLALVERRGHVIGKEELMGALWPDTAVEESNLTHHISVLRKALGESAGERAYIETVPRRGYRFLAEVRAVNGAGTQPADGAAAIPGGAVEPPPSAPGIDSPAPRQSRAAIIPYALAFLIPVLIGVGLWLHYKLDRAARVDRLEFKGNFYVTRWTEDEIRKGIEQYNHAVVLDPNSASAHQGLASGWTALSDLYLPPREAMPKAKAAVMKALELEETSAHAHISLGLIKAQYEWDWAGAEQEFKRALALAPDYDTAHLIYGWYLIAVGRLEEAQAEMKRALELAPLNDYSLWGLGDAFYFARHYGHAVEQYRRAIGVEPQSHWTHLMLGCAYEQQGKFSEAIAELKRARRLNDRPQVLAALGHAYAASGRRAEAQQVIEELQELAERRYVSPYDIAAVYAGLGEQERALAWLERAYEDRSGWLGLWLKVDPKFDGLRADPRFADLLRRVGLTP